MDDRIIDDRIILVTFPDSNDFRIGTVEEIKEVLESLNFSDVIEGYNTEVEFNFFNPDEARTVN